MTLIDRWPRQCQTSPGSAGCRRTSGGVLLLLLPILAVGGPPQTVELPTLPPDPSQCLPPFPETPMAPGRSPPPPRVKPDRFHIDLPKRFEEVLLSKKDPLQQELERRLLDVSSTR